MQMQFALRASARLAATAALVLSAGVLANLAGATPAQAATLPTPGVHTLTARSGSNCLDVLHSDQARYVPVVQFSCSGAGSQKWKLNLVGGTTSTWTLENDNSGRCLGIAGALKDNMVPAVQDDCGGASYLQWTIAPSGSSANTYKVTNVNSGKCLKIPFGITGDNVPVVQGACTGGTDYEWTVAPA